jgi:hypothetical protein
MQKDMTVFPNLKPEDRNTYRLGNNVTTTQDSETMLLQHNSETISGTE